MSVILYNALTYNGTGIPNCFNNNGFTTTNYASSPLPPNSAAKNCFWFVPSSSNFECTIQLKPEIALISSHIYYFSFQVYSPYSTATGTFDLYWPIAEPPCFSGLAPQNKSKTWMRLSARFNRTAFPDSNGSMDMRLDYNNNYSSQGYNMSDFMLIDLTQSFGIGNEPSKQWCDENIAWFSGEKIISDQNRHTTLVGLFDDIADSIRYVSGTSGEIIADTFPEKIVSAYTKDDLNNLTWDQISNLPDSYLLSIVGKTKNVSISGYGTQPFQLVGVNQDILASGEGTAKCTFMASNVITNRQMNSSRTNSGGWNSSSLRTFSNGTFYNALPSDLRNIIKTVRKRYSIQESNNSGINQCEDKIFIPSARELIGSYYSLEGFKYIFFTLENSSYNKNSSYWIRSMINPSDTSYSGKSFGAIYSDGTVRIYYSNSSIGFVPCFCI